MNLTLMFTALKKSLKTQKSYGKTTNYATNYIGCSEITEKLRYACTNQQLRVK